MAKRNSTKRIDSDVVQGEGSYVVVRRLKIGGWRTLREKSAKEDADNFAIDLETIQEYIVEWNWVDDDGEPLAFDAVDDLTIEEKSFLIGAIFTPER